MSDNTLLNRKISIGNTEVPLLYLLGGAALLFIIFLFIGGGSGTVKDEFGNKYHYQRMADGRVWTTDNMNAAIVDSYCYGNMEENCDIYGRLYTWQSAQNACASLGRKWRLPTDEEWGKLAEAYGGYKGNSEDGGVKASAELLENGSSGFNGKLGGFGLAGSRYYYAGEMGAYWSGTELDGRYAWNYGFAMSTKELVRDKITKSYGLCVRCIKD